ncbi:ribosome-recycling factor, mitochondrial isoform X2 [Prorops nasuta]
MTRNFSFYIRRKDFQAFDSKFLARNTQLIRSFAIADRIKSSNSFSTSAVLLKEKDRGKDKKKKPLPQNIDFREIAEVFNVDKLKDHFNDEVEELKKNFIANVSLRTTAGSIEELPVKFEGDDFMLHDLAQIARKPKVIVLNVSAFPQAIPDIVKAIEASKMNLNPQLDGSTIYLPLPKVTKEHRENLSKAAKALYIKCRDKCKKIQNDYIRKLENKEGYPDDKKHRIKGFLEVLCNQYIKQAETLLKAKQTELLGESD